MASFNSVILMGNLTRDVQLKFLPNQTAVAEFGLASSRKFKGQNGEDREEVTFVDCTAFAKTAELINQYFSKGKPIFIQGRLKYDSWDDKNGGGKRSKLSVIVDRFEFIGGNKVDNAGNGDGEQTDYTPPARTAPGAHRHPTRQPAPKPEQPFGDEAEFKEADIPW